MVSVPDGEEFLGFENEEPESEESNILVSASESESSSQSDSEEEIEQRWTTDNLPDHVEKFVKPTGPTS